MAGEAVRAGRPDVRRVRRRALRLQVRALLLRQRHLSAGAYCSELKNIKKFNEWYLIPNNTQ